MKIFLVDEQKWILVTLDEARNILESGLKPEEITRDNIQPYLLF